MGAGVMNPGLRTAVEMDWRLQTNKPDPVIRVSQEISTSAGAKPGSDVRRAGAKNAQAAVVPTASLWSPSCALGRGSWHLSGRTQKAQLAGGCQVSLRVASVSPPGFAWLP